ncbi:MAG: hypothetical protein ACFE92_02365 [Promethearchaeota archaeon]
MAFGKAFLLSIAAFVGLNFIFTIIYYAIGPGFDVLFNDIQDYPLLILYYLFGSIISTPYIILNYIVFQPIFVSFILENFLLWIGYLIAPIIAAILAGRFGESKIECLGAWLLTTGISTISVIIAALLSPTTQARLLTKYFLTSFNELIIFAIISCVINMLFYGFFALLLSKIEYY